MIAPVSRSRVPTIMVDPVRIADLLATLAVTYPDAEYLRVRFGRGMGSCYTRGRVVNGPTPCRGCVVGLVIRMLYPELHRRMASLERAWRGAGMTTTTALGRFDAIAAPDLVSWTEMTPGEADMFRRRHAGLRVRLPGPALRYRRVLAWIAAFQAGQDAGKALWVVKRDADAAVPPIARRKHAANRRRVAKALST